MRCCTWRSSPTYRMPSFSVQVAAIVVATSAEMAQPQSILMASVRPYLTILQVCLGGAPKNFPSPSTS